MISCTLDGQAICGWRLPFAGRKGTVLGMKHVSKKVLKWFLVGIIGIYILLAGGLALLNYWTPEHAASQGAQESSLRADHQVIQQSSGTHSFYERLKRIEDAKRSVDLEFFIYNVDEASRIFTQALIKKAEGGVRIRILVDFSGPVFQLKPVYARYLRGKGIQVRYYNSTALYQIVSSQHRSHRKLQIVDASAVILGGRNIANEYFDLGKDYNFLDTDVEVRGPIVPSILRSFDLYWNSNFSKEPEDIAKPLNAEELKRVRDFLEPQPGDAAIVARVREAGAAIAARTKVHTCKDISFVSDFPNQGENNRKVFKAIVKELNQARREVVAESPYFVIKKGGYEVLSGLRERNVHLSVLTNGLYSTDAFYTVASMLFRLRSLAETNMTLKVYDGKGRRGRQGIHNKRAVIDGKTVMVGTYNIDPRSANLNSEMMIVCRDQPELAAEFLADITAHAVQSRLAIADGDADMGAVLKDATLGQLALTAITFPLANLFDFLL